MDKLISIIVPVYNVEKYIVRCLDSLLVQTHENFEAILVDDGSTDKSGAICDEYAKKDPRFKVIHTKNGGVCAARNKALEIAKGDYIGFVDPDDECTPDMFEYLLKGAEENGAEISCCRHYQVVPGEMTMSQCDGRTRVFSKEEAITELVKGSIIRNVFWNKLFKKELFEGVRFPDIKIYEGTVLVHKLVEKCEKFVLLGDAKYYYYTNAGSLVNTKSVEYSLQFALSYIERCEDLCEKYPELKNKLMRDAVSAIRKLRYSCFHMTNVQATQHESELKKIQAFMLENKEYVIENIMTTKRLKREYNALSRVTPAGFKRAHDIAGMGKLNDKVLRKLGIKRKKRRKKKRGGEIVPEMTPEREATLRRLQAVLYELLGIVDDICKRNGLRYYLYGGTLLGAVRGKEIIPWDDDMDLVMYRDDYEKFAEICKKELPEGYFYQTCFTDEAYPMMFAKIRKDGTYVRERKWDDKEMHKGIYIDILPLDHFPKNKFLTKVYLHIASFLHQVCAFKNCHSDNIVTRLAFKLAKKLPVTYWYKKRDKFLKFCNRHGSKELVCSFGSHYQPMTKRILKSEWFGEPTELEMNGRMYMAPGKWEGYLLHLFGENYMELPPQEDRVCHGDLDSIRFDSNDADNI